MAEMALQTSLRSFASYTLAVLIGIVLSSHCAFRVSDASVIAGTARNALDLAGTAALSSVEVSSAYVILLIECSSFSVPVELRAH